MSCPRWHLVQTQTCKFPSPGASEGCSHSFFHLCIWVRRWHWMQMRFRVVPRNSQFFLHNNLDFLYNDTMTSINFIISEDKPTLFSGSELHFEIQWDFVVLLSPLGWPPCYEVNCIRVWSKFFPVWFALWNFVWLHSKWNSINISSGLS